MNRATAEVLWDEAQGFELEGQLDLARDTYGALVAHLQKLKHRVPLLLVERLAHALSRVDEARLAILFLSAMRKRGAELGDAYTIFRAIILSAEVALGAGDVESCERFLEQLEDDIGALPDTNAAQASGILERIARVQIRGTTTDDRRLVRSELGLLFARLWANQGQFKAAIAACESALRTLQKNERLLSLRDTEILLLELNLAVGDFHRARRLLGELDSRSEAVEKPRGWHVLRARLATLEGRLSDARKILGRGLSYARQRPLSPTDVQATWALLQTLVLLNRVGDADELLGTMQSRIVGAPVQRTIEGRLADAAALLRMRRERITHDLGLPFTAKQVWENGALATKQGPQECTSLRSASVEFVERWGTAANMLLQALETKDADAQLACAEQLRSLADTTDSLLFKARTQYYLALVAYYRGEIQGSKSLAHKALSYFNQQELLLDQWRVQHILVWVAANEGDVVAYTRASVDAQATLQAISAQLDPEDRVYFALNKWSAQDDYVAARITTLKGRQASKSAWFERWIDTLSTLEVYRAVDRLVGWDLNCRLNGHDESARQDVDVLTTVLNSQLRLGRGRRRRGISLWRLLWLMPHRAVLHYYVLPDRLIAFMLWRGVARVRVFHSYRVDLDDTIRDLLRSTFNEFERGGNRTLVERRARKLGDLLGLDLCLRELPAAIKELYIVPHDVLVNVPFALLPTENGLPLCARVVVTHLPHLETLAPWRMVRAPRPDGTLVSVGLSDYPGSELESLPGAESEALAIAQLAQAESVDVRVLVGEGATLRGTQDALAQATWAHIACHGEFDIIYPHRSGMYLRDATGTGVASLTLADIAAMSLPNLRLVVLSSCWTGTSAVLPANEWVCVPQAFLSAGVGAVLCPIWEISDELGLAFMRDLYAKLLRMPVAAALSETQSQWAASANPDHSMPFAWSGFRVFEGVTH